MRALRTSYRNEVGNINRGCHYHHAKGMHRERTSSPCIPFVCFALLLVCVACSAVPAPPKQASNPQLGAYALTPAPATLHAPTGTLTLAGLQSPDTLNPLFADIAIDGELDAALWGQPVFYDQQFHVHADQLTEVPLPENGDVLDQGKTVVMHLRHDLRWSDGQPLQASDFAYWWHLNQDPNTGATLTSGYDQIASITTPDSFTVILHMKRPYGPYLSYLPFAAPQHAWGKLHAIDLQNQTAIFQAPQVTSGPYKLLSWQDGQRYTLIPNTYYRSSTFRGPFLARLIYQVYADGSALSTAARQHNAGVTMGYSEAGISLLAQLPPTVQLRTRTTTAYEHLDFNLARPLWQDSRIRRALQLALDVCGMLKTVVHAPDCSRRATQVEPSPSFYYDAAIQPAPYDPGGARQLLKQAGWLLDAQGMLRKAGRPFTLQLVTTAHNVLRAATASSIQQQLRTIGIQVQINTYSPGLFFGGYTKGGILASGQYDLSLFSYADGPDADDEYDVFHSSQIPTETQPDLGNYGRVHDALIDAALSQGQNSITIADRITAYHHFLERLAAQVYVIPLYTDVEIMTVSQRVQNVILNPNQFAPTWNIADWWVANSS